jgi:hypothetical protein
MNKPPCHMYVPSSFQFEKEEKMLNITATLLVAIKLQIQYVAKK